MQGAKDAPRHYQEDPMPITPISGPAGSIQQQNIQKADAKLQIALGTLASGSKLGRASDDVAGLALATQLQTEVAGLRQVSGNLAQASTQAQVIDGGIEQIQGLLDEAAKVATQAKSPTLTAENRQALNVQFQELTAEIDRIAETTSFGGQKLLDGSLTGDNALSLGKALGENSGANELTVESLTTGSLFEGRSLDVLTTEGAQNALAALSAAFNRTAEARVDVAAFQQSVGFAAAAVDSAVSNQDAARSILEDADFADVATGFSLANVQRNAAIAIAAQGNRINPTILQLIG